MSTTLPPLPQLPQLPGFGSQPAPQLASPSSQFAPIGGGDGSSSGGGFPSLGGITLGLSGIALGGAASSVIPAGFAPTAAALQSQGCSWFDVLCLGKSQLTRLFLLLLGFICIIGAIYLYKPTNQAIVAPIVKGAKHAARTAAEIGAAAA